MVRVFCIWGNLFTPERFFFNVCFNHSSQEMVSLMPVPRSWQRACCSIQRWKRLTCQVVSCEQQLVFLYCFVASPLRNFHKDTDFLWMIPKTSYNSAPCIRDGSVRSSVWSVWLHVIFGQHLLHNLRTFSMSDIASNVASNVSPMADILHFGYCFVTNTFLAWV